MNTTARLTGLRHRLEDLGRLSPTLRRFHDRRRGLLDEVGEQAPRLAWLVRGRDLQALETQVAALEDLAHGLIALTEDAERLRQRLDTLGDKSAGLRNATLSAWFRERAAAVAEGLAGAGESAIADEAVAAERRRLRGIEDELADLERALDLYQEAEGWLQRLQAEARKAELAADLPGLGERLLVEGVGADWIAALQRLLEPLRAYRQRPKPPGLRDLGPRIQGLLQWGEVLGADCPRCRRLAQDFTRKNQDWALQDDDAIAALGDETQDLENALLGQAQARLRTWLCAIESHKALLRELGERDDALERVQERLAGDSPRDATAFVAWRTDFAWAEERFRSLVATRSLDLERRYAVLAKACREQVACLGQRPCLAAAHSRLQDLAQALARLEPMPDGEGLLTGIGTLRDLGAGIEALGQAIERDQADLDARRAALEARRGRLAELAPRLGQALPPALQRPAAEAGAGGEPGAVRLEQAQAAAGALEQALAAAEADLLAAGLSHLDAAWGRVTAIGALLPSLPVPGPEAGRLPALPAAVADLAPALEAAAAALGQAEDRLGAELACLRQQRDTLLARAAGVAPGRLGPLQARQVEQRRQLLAAWPLQVAADSLDLARSLHELVLAMRLILQPVEQAETRARTLRKTLGERLQRLNLRTPAPQFPEACQEWAQRIEALIAPTEQVRRPIQAETAQLEEAARLLGALEVHCRRLAAAQDAADIARLKELRQRPADPEADALLAPLAALPRHEPPPDWLRLGLLELIAARLETRDHDL